MQFGKDPAVSCQTLRRLRRVILTSRVVLIHDSARPHNAVLTKQLLKQFTWDVSDHAAYSPDLAKSDFHLFSELRNGYEANTSRKMRRFKAMLRSITASLASTFFEEGIGNLVHRYDKCLSLHGDNVEN
ncbi:hypothetical protein AVEN_228153-1 [Araneus ventricosus]|uniref:Histone-lysine N-methyltransferase SETMAR n=1 Tax=Araneus ventricosus TaxID=182803 RepID=A0A4Y2CT62_ARAVE|nr:hypothetical protein AVEN_228153-1 [Araneus ventricosus]